MSLEEREGGREGEEGSLREMERDICCILVCLLSVCNVLCSSRTESVDEYAENGFAAIIVIGSLCACKVNGLLFLTCFPITPKQVQASQISPGYKPHPPKPLPPRPHPAIPRGLWRTLCTSCRLIWTSLASRILWNWSLEVSSNASWNRVPRTLYP